MIPSQTLKYRGFKEHPFADDILRDNALNLFINREDELDELRDSINHCRITGIYGTQGVGKSSFLQKLQSDLISNKIAVAFIHLRADSTRTLYREILHEVLLQCMEKKLKLKTNYKVNIKKELERLEATLTLAHSFDFGVKPGGIGGKYGESEAIQLIKHDDSSALTKIELLFNAIKQPLIVILDDFHILKYEFNTVSSNYFPILSRFLATFEEHLHRNNIRFIISIDDQVVDLVKNARKRGGTFKFSLDNLIELPNLIPEYLNDLIKTRLQVYGWKKRTSDFITKDAFWALSLASDNHPRRAVRIIAQGMRFIAKRNDKDKRITLNDIFTVVKKIDNKIDEKNWLLIKYLEENDGASESDRDFQKVLKLKSRSALRNRLSQVQKSIQLQTKKVPSGKTHKIKYYLPKLDFK